ncbi:MAG: DUF86 domain-containing protein [Candidatus Bipolaricaulota bacterium]
MIKRDIVAKRLEVMAARVAHLRSLQARSAEEFRQESEVRYAAERLLQTAIQSMLDVGAHVLAALGDTEWDEYRQIPTRLSAHGIIDDSTVSTLQEMSAMRNILVHQYVEVDPLKVHDVLQTRLDDFDRFAEAVVRFMEREEQSP